jgi:hypothetical protein
MPTNSVTPAEYTPHRLKRLRRTNSNRLVVLIAHHIPHTARLGIGTRETNAR